MSTSITFHTGTLSAETQSLLLELLQSVYGSSVQLKHVQVVNQHHDYAALRVILDHPSVELAVKLAGREAPYPYPFDHTAFFHRLVASQTSIPMPTIVSADVSYHVYPWRYLIKTYLPGEEWATVYPKLQGEALRQAYKQLGNAVAELHLITFEQFGEINDEKDGSTNHVGFYETLVERVNKSIRRPRLQEEFLKLLAANRHLFESITQPRLCHEDLHPHNILFEQTIGEWRLATILDFDKAWAGHAEIDLAKMDLWVGMTGDGFRESYTRRIAVDDLYLQRRPIYQLWWCLEYGANTPLHLADTRRLCDLLHFPLIERFE